MRGSQAMWGVEQDGPRLHGVKGRGVSVVTRYTHGPNAIVNMDDVDAAIRLQAEMANAEYAFASEEKLPVKAD